MISHKEKENFKAISALNYIIPILDKYKFWYVITGGFACYVYGVDRLLTDIDIDINTSIESSEFIHFLDEVSTHISQELIHYVDENYDNYNFELSIKGQIIDICPMQELKVYDKKLKNFVAAYPNGLPEIETVEFNGYKLPLLGKKLIIENNQRMPEQDKWRILDTKQLQKLILSPKI